MNTTYTHYKPLPLAKPSLPQPLCGLFKAILFECHQFASHRTSYGLVVWFRRRGLPRFQFWIHHLKKAILAKPLAAGPTKLMICVQWEVKPPFWGRSGSDNGRGGIANVSLGVKIVVMQTRRLQRYVQVTDLPPYINISLREDCNAICISKIPWSMMSFVTEGPGNSERWAWWGYYLTNVTTAYLRRHLPDMNVIVLKNGTKGWDGGRGGGGVWGWGSVTHPWLTVTFHPVAARALSIVSMLIYTSHMIWVPFIFCGMLPQSFIPMKIAIVLLSTKHGSQTDLAVYHMMTSSNGNIFCVTCHLCIEFTGPRWIPRTKGRWRGALMFSLICVRIKDWVNKREAGDLRRHRAHYDVTVTSL